MDGEATYNISSGSIELVQEAVYVKEVNTKKDSKIFGCNNYLLSVVKKISDNASEMDAYLVGIKENIKANIRVINSDLASKLKIEKDYIELNQTKNLVASKDGITISINKVFFDGGELVILSKLTSDKEVGENRRFRIIDSNVYVNEIKIRGEENQCSYKLDKCLAEEERRYNIEDFSLSGQADIKIVFANVSINNSIKWGPWIFKTRVYC
ncbi:DUF4179 domain-containing protein [Inconstantimicrobium mannanitabidum]|uniref:Uncharacterized protein n=1 Tax=Inconstantimicrobium mannanitabidum TaxID=1604901 RepID=A0ACB5R7R6_9CLOT|nr:DUF4179 domain-containing protein [Clostridium sp. TW13]GKX65059.1 hypothetical protein rsdtw13_03170 [Clostridium sp. TW13]